MRISISNRLLTALMIIGLVESTAVQASRPDTGTSQNLFVHQALNGGWYLASRSNAATREGVGDLFFGYIDLSLGRKLTPNWSVDITCDVIRPCRCAQIPW